MRVILVTPKHAQLPPRISHLTRFLCGLLVLSGTAVALGLLFQLLALLSPFLIAVGLALLKCSLIAFLAYRALLWFWRLGLRRLWINTYAYRRAWLLSARIAFKDLLRLLILVLFR